MLSLKFILQVILPLLLLVLAFLIGRHSVTHTPPMPAGTFHAGLTIDRLREVSELLVVQLDVTDVVVASLHGKTGGVQVVLLVKGDVSLAIDITAARFGEVNDQNRTAVLSLPPPTASRPRLDHTRTRIVLMRKEGLWQLSPAPSPYSAATDQAMAEAQTLVHSAGTNADASQRARSHAEQVLLAFFRSIDWTVQIRWTSG